ncbi:MAG: nucleotidyltransferase family protein [Proteobacteria bacterium]|nr:nucleotidyltransferase family protein [Pseudomonadota bacterium]
MKTIEQLKKNLARHKSELVKKYHIKRMGIFGSYARGDKTPRSDVDVLVEFEEPIGLEFVTLAEELESLLGVKVDLVSINAIKPKMLNLIKQELIYV